MSVRAWQPILSGPEAARARALIDASARELREHSEREGVEEPWIVLLFAYLAREGGGQAHARTAEQLLDAAIEQLAELPLTPALHGGYAATAWVVAHLARARGEQPADPDPNAEIDEALIDELEQDQWAGCHDLIAGLAGLGTYALERLHRPSSVRCLELVIDRLWEQAEVREHGLSWRTPAREWAGPPPQRAPSRFDLGIAHGAAGVVAMLARSFAAGVRTERARELTIGAVEWLAAQRLAEGSGSRVPHWVGHEVETHEARQAWCYGGLGIAPALITAARCLARPEWEQLALDYALAEAARPFADTGIVDPYFCHGTIGAAHLFNRVYQATGETRLLLAARDRIRQTFEHHQDHAPETIVGFRPLLMPSPGGELAGRDRWIQTRGLLNGIAGISLVLLSSISTEEPRWDRALQAEIPPA